MTPVCKSPGATLYAKMEDGNVVTLVLSRSLEHTPITDAVFAFYDSYNDPKCKNDMTLFDRKSSFGCADFKLLNTSDGPLASVVLQDSNTIICEKSYIETNKTMTIYRFEVAC